MFFVYILYSVKADKYYIGHSTDSQRRLIEHNQIALNSFTSKYRPWVLKATLPIGKVRGDSIRVEKYIKRLKSRRVIQKVIEKQNDSDYIKYLINKSKAG